MERIIISILCLIFGTVFCPQKTHGGDMPSVKKVALFTDRTLYVAGEQVLFYAFWRFEPVTGDRILYVEIITPDGTKITGGKYLFEPDGTGGCLQIPRDLLTGIYYIRAYTRSMRNTGPSIYAYVPLRLINPFKPDLLTSNAPAETGNRLSSFSTAPEGRFFTFVNDGLAYRTREQAGWQVRTNAGMPSVKGMCIFVVPEGAAEASDPDRLIVQCADLPAGRDYHIENTGLSLSGILMDKSAEKPVQKETVTLSIMGDRDFSAYETDRDGRFFFTLPPYAGKKDIFLSSDGNSINQYLLIDNDFCTIPVHLPDPPFSLSEAESELAYRMAINEVVSDQYASTQQVLADTGKKASDRPFYGEPSVTLVMDKYIQLPTLEEYFNELPLEVKVRERREGKYFRFLSQDMAVVARDPLVLVDWVVIGDIGKILSLSPQKISKIEIVNRPYIKGNLTFGGIISILSKQGDFGGIDLPGSGLFLNYDFLSPACNVLQSTHGAPGLPDPRNTVLWMPGPHPDGNGAYPVSFVTPDTPGIYEVCLRAVLSDGTIVWQSAQFEVSQ